MWFDCVFKTALRKHPMKRIIEKQCNRCLVYDILWTLKFQSGNSMKASSFCQSIHWYWMILFSREFYWVIRKKNEFICSSVVIFGHFPSNTLQAFNFYSAVNSKLSNFVYFVASKVQNHSNWQKIFSTFIIFNNVFYYLKVFSTYLQ